jgi:UDP-N-acetylglucosamine:LPS N-acetylglucosamine transferase
MRALIIQQSPSKGGALTFTERLINYCKINKINTSLICNNIENEHFIHYNIDIIINPRITSIKIMTHPIRIFLKIIQEIYALSTIIRKVKPDVIFVSNIAQGTLLGTIFFRKPILFFFHTYPDQKYDWFTHLYIKIFSSLKCVYITVSKYSGIKVAKYLGLPIDSVKILYNYAYKGNQLNTQYGNKVAHLPFECH